MVCYTHTNPEYHDRKDLKSYKKKLSVWIRNYNRITQDGYKVSADTGTTRRRRKLAYARLNEGSTNRTSTRVYGAREIADTNTDRTEKGPQGLYMGRLRQEIWIYNSYENKALGKCFTIYKRKYVTKDLAKTRIGLNEHLYYCSQGLKRSELIYTGQLTKELEEDYSNEYVKIKTETLFSLMMMTMRQF